MVKTRRSGVVKTRSSSSFCSWRHLRKMTITKSKRRRNARRRRNLPPSSETLLPQEMWESVMEYLGPADLCNLALVSRCLYGMATGTKLWSRVSINHLSKTKLSYEGILSLFGVSRFSRIKLLDLSVVRSVGKSLFRLPTFEFQALFKFIIETQAQGNLTITNLNLRHENLENVEPNQLAMAVSFLETVDLSYTRLSMLQCILVLSEIRSSRYIQDVRLVSVVLSQVPSQLLAAAVNNLRRADLSWTHLTTDQCSDILSYEDTTNLTDLTLVGINLTTETSRVPVEVLARAGRQLRKINLSSAKATSEQYEALLEGSLASKNLVDLNLESGTLARVPASLLSRAVSRFTRCDLSSTYLETDQLTALLSSSMTSTTLCDLNLDNVNLSGVEADLLASAVARLRSVDLSATRLVKAQTSALIKKCVASKQLREMKIHFVNLKGVPGDLIEKLADKFSIY